MPSTPYVASLRVYEPITAFSPADQLRWSQIELDKNTQSEEQNLALQRIILPESPALRPDGVHIRQVDGARYVCPWSTATRCWAGLERFKTSLPAPVILFFLPLALEEVLTSGMDFAENKVPHILTETWIVPPRWFSLFTPEERMRGRTEQGAFTIMRTSIAKAKDRCDSAHQAVLDAFGIGSVEEEIENLGEWLKMFHPESIVELDYGGLADYLERSLIANGETGLEADTSIEDVLHSVGGLSRGDGEAAGVGYERLVSRWRAVASFEQAT